MNNVVNKAVLEEVEENCVQMFQSAHKCNTGFFSPRSVSNVLLEFIQRINKYKFCYTWASKVVQDGKLSTWKKFYSRAEISVQLAFLASLFPSYSPAQIWWKVAQMGRQELLRHTAQIEMANCHILQHRGQIL